MKKQGLPKCTGDETDACIFPNSLGTWLQFRFRWSRALKFCFLSRLPSGADSAGPWPTLRVVRVDTCNRHGMFSSMLAVTMGIPRSHLAKEMPFLQWFEVSRCCSPISELTPTCLKLATGNTLISRWKQDGPLCNADRKCYRAPAPWNVLQPMIGNWEIKGPFCLAPDVEPPSGCQRCRGWRANHPL